MVSKHQAELVQIDHCRLETMQVLGVLAAGRWQTCSKKKSSKCKCCCTQKIPQEIPWTPWTHSFYMMILRLVTYLTGNGKMRDLLQPPKKIENNETWKWWEKHHLYHAGNMFLHSCGWPQNKFVSYQVAWIPNTTSFCIAHDVAIPLNINCNMCSSSKVQPVSLISTQSLSRGPNSHIPLWGILPLRRVLTTMDAPLHGRPQTFKVRLVPQL